VENRKVTIRDVATRANVSIASVSLFLNNKPGLAEETRDRIADAISSLGYVRRRATPNTNARYIALFIEALPFSPMADMFYGEVIHGVDASARELGYNITLMIVQPNDDIPALLGQHNGGLAGAIMLGSGDISRATIDAVLTEKLPAVLVDNCLPDLPMDCVLPDYVGGANAATTYLLQQGYRRIAFLHGATKYRSLVERFRGYCTALIEADMPVRPELVQRYLSSGLPNKGYLEMKTLLESGEKFDAVFCVTDRTALGALQALQEANVRVPEDIALIGFDNVAQASHTRPALTTVNVPRYAMGEIAVRRLCGLLEGQSVETPIKHLLYTDLVIRESA
jgi:LacI family transcriptional regulator